MNNLRQETVNTYNHSAKELAKYFDSIGSRKLYIDLAFKLAGNPKNARVVEIGCGDGRDAKDIIKHTNWYLGFDISDGLLEFARKLVPTVEFVIADAADFNFPSELDVVFAFASLLHLNKKEVQEVLKRVHAALKPGGIFYISLKYASRYTEKIKKDQFGRRQFYFYNPELIKGLAGEGYEVVATIRETIGHTEWFEIALKKV